MAAGVPERRAKSLLNTPMFTPPRKLGQVSADSWSGALQYRWFRVSSARIMFRGPQVVDANCATSLSANSGLQTHVSDTGEYTRFTLPLTANLHARAERRAPPFSEYCHAHNV